VKSEKEWGRERGRESGGKRERGYFCFITHQFIIIIGNCVHYLIDEFFNIWKYLYKRNERQSVHYIQSYQYM
jgi:hypothetical protein